MSGFRHGVARRQGRVARQERRARVQRSEATTRTAGEVALDAPAAHGPVTRTVVVLGCGAAGAFAANRLRGRLDPARVRVVAVDRRERRDHELLLLEELGLYGPRSVRPPEDRGLRAGIEFRHAEAGTVDTARREVCLVDGTTVPYDVLVVASGRRPGVPAPGSPSPLGASCVRRSPGLGDERGLLAVDPRTRRCAEHPDVFAVGGAAAGPGAASGAARHAEAELLVDGVRRRLDALSAAENVGPAAWRGGRGGVGRPLPVPDAGAPDAGSPDVGA